MINNYSNGLPHLCMWQEKLFGRLISCDHPAHLNMGEPDAHEGDVLWFCEEHWFMWTNQMKIEYGEEWYLMYSGVES